MKGKFIWNGLKIEINDECMYVKKSKWYFHGWFSEFDFKNDGNFTESISNSNNKNGFYIFEELVITRFLKIVPLLKAITIVRFRRVPSYAFLELY